MQLHPELTTTLVVQHERDLHTRAEQRRMLSALVPRATSGGGAAGT
jgi:hypothetical protein